MQSCFILFRPGAGHHAIDIPFADLIFLTLPRVFPPYFLSPKMPRLFSFPFPGRFVFHTERAWRAGLSTFFTLFAELLQTEINGFVNRERQVRNDGKKSDGPSMRNRGS